MARRRGSWGCGTYIMSWAVPVFYLGWPWFVASGGAALAIEAVWLAVSVPVLVHLGRKGRVPRRLSGPRSAALTPRRRLPLRPEVKSAVWVRDGGRCRKCRISDSDAVALTGEHLHYDHVIPWSLGGSDEELNIQLLCGPDNRAKGASLPW